MCQKSLASPTGKRRTFVPGKSSWARAGLILLGLAGLLRADGRVVPSAPWQKDPVPYSLLADRIVRTALEGEEGYRFLKELCAIGPRLSGSEKMGEAVRWARKKMEDLGLERVRLQPVTVAPWERGDGEEAFLLDEGGAEKSALRIAALGGSVGTEGSWLAGGVVEVQSIEELRLRAVEVRSKFVFFNALLDQGTPNTDTSYDAVVTNRMEGADAASEAGAVAVLVRSLTTKRDDVPHTGVVKYAGKARSIPAAALSWKAADDLSAALRQGPGLKVKMRLACRRLPERRTFNVIGEIRGRETPDEIVVVAGHLDSWDLGVGAHDDGGGCLQALEVLSLVRRLGLHPKRTIRCVLYADEEFLSRGAAVYAEAAARSGEKHVAAMESDRGVFDPRGFSLTGTEACLKRVREWLPLLAKAHIEWVRPGDGGTADVSWIKNAEAVFGLLNDSQRYMDLHHSAHDVYEAVHPHEMELGTAAMAILAVLVSEEGLSPRGE